MADIKVVCGDLGSGKSSYALSKINPKRTFKLGTGTAFRDILFLRPFSTCRHKKENQRVGISARTTSIKTVVYDIQRVRKPTLLIDEWSNFFHASMFWSRKRIEDKAGAIFEVIEANSAIEQVVVVTLTHQSYLYQPFNLYKKKALWNRLLFKRADSIVKIYCGLADRIK